MASASPQEDAPVSTDTSSRETSSSSPRARAPRRPDMGTGCAALCFHLPRRSKKTKQPPLAKLSSGKSVDEPAAAAVLDASASQRVTFLASASLSTWWPSSPSAAAGGDVAWRRSSSSARAPGAGRRALSSSFSYWRRSQHSSSRVMPHGGAASARVSFSFPSSPVSVSSCMSTPKISHGCDHQE